MNWWRSRKCTQLVRVSAKVAQNSCFRRCLQLECLFAPTTWEGRRHRSDWQLPPFPADPKPLTRCNEWPWATWTLTPATPPLSVAPGPPCKALLLLVRSASGPRQLRAPEPPGLSAGPHLGSSAATHQLLEMRRPTISPTLLTAAGMQIIKTGKLLAAVINRTENTFQD